MKINLRNDVGHESVAAIYKPTTGELLLKSINGGYVAYNARGEVSTFDDTLWSTRVAEARLSSHEILLREGETIEIEL